VAKTGAKISKTWFLAQVGISWKSSRVSLLSVDIEDSSFFSQSQTSVAGKGIDRK
jgi:hypothetical protein